MNDMNLPNVQDHAKPFPKRGLIFVALSFVTAALLVGGSIFFVQFTMAQMGQLQVETQGEIFVNGTKVGTDHYQGSLNSNSYTIKVQNGSHTMERMVDISPGTLTILSAPSDENGNLNSNYILSVVKGTGLTVMSSIPDVVVSLDEQEVGNTPLRLTPAVGAHKLTLKKEGYLEKSLDVNVNSGWKTVASITLAKAPISLTPSPSTVSSPLTQPVVVTPQLRINQTGTGFLRVRSGPSTINGEVGRVTPGDVLEILGSQAGWFNVKLPSGSTGWVSGQYVTKL